jgi:hypothetical protein
MESVLASVDAQTRSEMISALEAGVDAESVRQLWTSALSCGKREKCFVPLSYFSGAKYNTPCACMLLLPYHIVANDIRKSTFLNGQIQNFGPVVAASVKSVQHASGKIMNTLSNALICKYKPVILDAFEEPFASENMIKTIDSYEASSKLNFLNREKSSIHSKKWLHQGFTSAISTHLRANKKVSDMMNMVNHTASTCWSDNSKYVSEIRSSRQGNETNYEYMSRFISETLDGDDVLAQLEKNLESFIEESQLNGKTTNSFSTPETILRQFYTEIMSELTFSRALNSKIATSLE